MGPNCPPNRQFSVQVSLHIHPPPPSYPCGPPANGPACSKRDLPSQWTIVGLRLLLLLGPHSLSAAYYSLVLHSSTCTCVGPWLLLRAMKSAFWVSFSGFRTLLFSSRILAIVYCICPQPDNNVQVPHLMLRMKSEWSHCRARSGLLTWHPSASTVDSLLNREGCYIRFSGSRFCGLMVADSVPEHGVKFPVFLSCFFPVP